jgi:hypothetical protein
VRERWHSEGDGVADGTRTRDNQNHNLELYQLSYDHHPGRKLGRTARSVNSKSRRIGGAAWPKTTA